MKLPAAVGKNRYGPDGIVIPWDTASVHEYLISSGVKQTLRSTERAIQESEILPPALSVDEICDEFGREPVHIRVEKLLSTARRRRQQSLVLQLYESEDVGLVLFANDGRSGRRWLYLSNESLEADNFLMSLEALASGKSTVFWPHGSVTEVCRKLIHVQRSHELNIGSSLQVQIASWVFREPEVLKVMTEKNPVKENSKTMSHLDMLEAESIHILREVMSQAENPVMLYSVGKDSSVMLHLARKAFYPSPPPFPLMHVDTRWKFQAMYDFRDMMAKESGMELIVHINPEGVKKNINPFDHGSALHTDVMKTQGLKQALDLHGFDVAFGGARRDEEKSRAKERVFSFRTDAHRWDPKNQRPELWNIYNGYKNPGESIRVFPLSNWTELDIWEYIYREQISIVPLYFAAERPVVERDGMLIMVDDDRLELSRGEDIQLKSVRFRTLGCYPLTGAIESGADNLSAIVLELLRSRTSERQGRAIDSDSSGSMEKKKVEGYF